MNQYVDPQLALAQAVAYQAKYGWRVESYGPGQVTMVRGRRANHILHLLLSVFTFGLWLPVWLCIGLSSGETRTVLMVDGWGQVHRPGLPIDGRTWREKYVPASLRGRVGA